MSLTYGFYNSMNHDRIYDARDFSRIFDGIINDGIYATIGDCFIVKAQSDFTVTVGTGRAWFNGTWTLNDSLYPVSMPLPDIIRPRIDCIVLEIDTRDPGRANSIRVITGIAAAYPIKPALSPDDGVYWYPLCYIRREPNSKSISQADIENRVGFEETPFVTGILEVIDVEELFVQWGARLDDFIERETGDFSVWMFETQQEFNKWLIEQKKIASEFQNESEKGYDDWLDALQKMFNDFFKDIKSTLDGDTATSLYTKIRENELEHIITVGFADGEKIFSDDGTKIESIASDGRRLTKTFSDGFSKVTTVLKTSEGAILATQTKEFSSDGKLIRSEVIYV